MNTKKHLIAAILLICISSTIIPSEQQAKHDLYSKKRSAAQLSAEELSFIRRIISEEPITEGRSMPSSRFSEQQKQRIKKGAMFNRSLQNILIVHR